MICGSENICPLFPPLAPTPLFPSRPSRKKETPMGAPTQSGPPISSGRATKTPKVEHSQEKPSPPCPTSSQAAHDSSLPAGLPELAIAPYNEAREVAPIPVSCDATDMLVSDGSDDECDGHGWLRAPKDLAWPQKVSNIDRNPAIFSGRKSNDIGSHYWTEVQG